MNDHGSPTVVHESIRVIGLTARKVVSAKSPHVHPSIAVVAPDHHNRAVALACLLNGIQDSSNLRSMNDTQA